MSIQPQILGNSDTARLQQQLADLQRRMDRVGRTAGYIAPGGIVGGVGGHIAVSSITTAEILAGTITAEDIAAGSITTIQLYAGAIDAYKIQADNIAANTITSDKLSVSSLSAITANMGALTAGTINLGGAGSYIRASPGGSAKVEMDYLGIRAVNASNIQKFNFDATTGILTASAVISAETGSVIPTSVLAGQITTTQVSDDAITTPKIAANQVTAAKIFVGSLSAISADLGTITAGLVTGATFRTSATNPKIQLDSTGFKAINSSGTNVVNIPSNGGTSTFTGFLQAAGISLQPPNSFGGVGVSNSIEFRSQGFAYPVGRVTGVHQTSGTRTHEAYLSANGTNLSSDPTIISSQIYASSPAGHFAYVRAYLDTAQGNASQSLGVNVYNPNTGNSAQATLLDANGSTFFPLSGFISCGTIDASQYYHASPAGDSVYADWHRSDTGGGLFFEGGGGGWTMIDSTWVRMYGSKSLYVDNQIRATEFAINLSGQRFYASAGALNAGWMTESWGVSLWTGSNVQCPNAWSLIAGTQTGGLAVGQGNVWSTGGFYGWSDVAAKSEIESLQDAVKKSQRVKRSTTEGTTDAEVVSAAAPTATVLKKVRNLRGTKYKKKAAAPSIDGTPDGVNAADTVTEIGLIAQEVEQEFPELVNRWEPTELHPDGVVWLDAGLGLNAILLEAVKELADEVDSLRAQLPEKKK